jgi:predicted metal-dependent peptidase
MSAEEEAFCDRLIPQGRAYLVRRAPYIVHTAYALAPVAVYGIKTMCVTEGLVMGYNPTWIYNEPAFRLVDSAGMPIGYKVMGACLYHECWHPIRGLERMAALPDPEIANVAGDMPINHDLRVAEWVLPDFAIYPESFDLKPGLTMEQYYAQLQNNQELKKLLQQAKDGKGVQDPNRERGKPQIGPCSGQCGGVANNPIDKDLEKELDAKYGRHAAEKEQIKSATQRDINEHIRAQGRGTAPGFREEEVTFTKREFNINWRRELRHAFTRATGRVEAGGTAYSYAKIPTRSMLMGVIRPGLVTHQITFAFARDTSGSMGQDQLNSANNVIVSIMRKLGVHQVWLLDADTKVQREPELVTLKDIPYLEAKGRGGTSFIQPLGAMAKIKPKPDICIYLTDGDGTAPESPPKGLQIIWCIVPTPHGRKPADWGKMVVCSNDQKLRDPYYG